MQKYLSVLLVAVWLVGCGGEDPPPADTGPEADTQATDAIDDAASEDIIVDTGVDTGVDAAPECLLNEDCEGKVELQPCENAGCINGTCVAQEGPLCCSTADDCDPAAFPEAEKDCIDLVCENTLCTAVVTAEPCCLADDVCEGLTEECCEEAICEDYTCVVKPLENCCAQSSECDDGNEHHRHLSGCMHG